MTSRLDILAIDCRDPRTLADFWCAVLGYAVVDEGPEGVSIAHDEAWGDSPRPAHVPPGIDLVPVPERKTVKNRLHLDLRPVGVSQSEELERLLALGARHVDVGQPDDATWIVLADPEGNEFCLLSRTAPP